jgi:hypothetical protein
MRNLPKAFTPDQMGNRTPDLSLAGSIPLPLGHELYETHTICWPLQVRVRLGLYSEFLEDWLATFPGQVHVELLDDYAADKLPVMNRIYRFLGVGKSSIASLAWVSHLPGKSSTG